MVDFLVAKFPVNSPTKQEVSNLSPNFHHILHTEVQSKQRTLSPSAHSGGNLA